MKRINTKYYKEILKDGSILSVIKHEEGNIWYWTLTGGKYNDLVVGGNDVYLDRYTAEFVGKDFHEASYYDNNYGWVC